MNIISLSTQTNSKDEEEGTFIMSNVVYIRMKKRVNVTQYQSLTLEDIAHISSPKENEKKLLQLPIYRITKNDHHIVIIDSFIIIKHLRELYSQLDFELLGVSETIVVVEQKQKPINLFIVLCVWLLLFVGSAMTIMNFHYDVSMQEVHQRIHFLLSGQHEEFPLFIQIPYSLGLGVGMMLFLNRIFRKKINEEPSPLEVEIHLYQNKVEEYLTFYENELNDEHYLL